MFSQVNSWCTKGTESGSWDDALLVYWSRRKGNPLWCQWLCTCKFEQKPLESTCACVCVCMCVEKEKKNIWDKLCVNEAPVCVKRETLKTLFWITLINSMPCMNSSVLHSSILPVLHFYIESVFISISSLPLSAPPPPPACTYNLRWNITSFWAQWMADHRPSRS